MKKSRGWLDEHFSARRGSLGECHHILGNINFICNVFLSITKHQASQFCVFCLMVLRDEMRPACEQDMELADVCVVRSKEQQVLHLVHMDQTSRSVSSCLPGTQPDDL